MDTNMKTSNSDTYLVIAELTERNKKDIKNI